MRLGKVGKTTKVKIAEEEEGVEVREEETRPQGEGGEEGEGVQGIQAVAQATLDNSTPPTPLAWTGADDPDLGDIGLVDMTPFKEEIPCPTCKARPCITCGGDGTVIGLVGYLLRKARESITPKLEQKQMAKLLNISSAYLSVLERGDKRFPEQLAVEYVRVLVENGWKVVQVGQGEKGKEEEEG